MRHARHLRSQRRLDRWIDNVAILLAFSSLVLSQIHPRIVWWVVLALSVGRIAFSAVYRWKERLAQAEWKASIESTESP
jgi:hypothetical protein